MKDIRLTTIPFELEGKIYHLRCNMNVLADIQSEFGGDLTRAFSKNFKMKSVLCALTAMLNDYADDVGWPERFTVRGLGRKLDYQQVPQEEIMELVVNAVFTPEQLEEIEKFAEEKVAAEKQADTDKLVAKKEKPRSRPIAKEPEDSAKN